MFFLQMSGYPGSGKSTLSREIGNITGAIIVDHDITKSAMLESIEEQVQDLKAVGKIAYQVDWAYIEFYLSQGHSVVFDSPCLYAEMIDRGTFLSQKYGACYKYVECYLNDYQEINSRLQNRNRLPSQIPETEKEAFQHYVNASKRPTEHEYLIIDSSRPVEGYIQKVLDYLEKS